ncbi:non-ribosomal peptide synthetase [Brenneria tiliae]|uniref:Amino acid adenylation domain-containing protein n=1 Tax=Brenneria tiliae TaxID=2914984 RepID=A0ABT0N1V7_9GAMM|nr:non-ribosomal peptide synthetase [Brenneria tiliae]MCL2895832.1 amino acid adenylation domain-containing protein [Brenneria tiliae]
MNTPELLRDLNQAGIELWCEGDKVRYRAPAGSMTDRRIALLRRHKSELLAVLAQQQRCWLSDPAQRFAPYPLTDLQSAYLLGRRDLFTLGGVDCHGYLEFRFDELNVSRLEQAWQDMVHTHDMLRTIVHENGTQQTLATIPEITIACEDMGHLPVEQQRSRWLKRRDAMSLFHGEPDSWPLVKLHISRLSNAVILHISFNLLVCDFQSARQLLSEFSSRYHGHPPLAAPGITFRDYVLSSLRDKEQPAYQQAREYWLTRIPTLPGPPTLPACQSPVTKHFFRLGFTLSPGQFTLISARAAQQGIGLTALFLTLYAETLRRWGGGSHFCLSLTTMQRQPLHEEVDKLIGDFSAVELLEVTLADQQNLIDQSRNLQEQLWRDLDNSALTGIEVMRELARQRGRDAAIFPVAFTSAICSATDCQTQLLPGAQQTYSITQTPQVALDCQIAPGEEGLTVNWDIREGTLNHDVAGAMFSAFQQGVLSLCLVDELWQQPLRLSLPEAQQRRRQQLNATERVLPIGLLHTPIWRQAQRTPEALALVDATGEISYRVLTKQADILAARLIQQGVKPGALVSIALEKGRTQIVAVLAVLRAGAAWFPLDLSLPIKRLSWLLALAKPELILSCSDWSLPTGEMIPPPPILFVDVAETAPLPAQWPALPANALAYVIFTSGSTGEPKGVMINHAAARNTIEEINRLLEIKPQDRMLGLANLSFDLAVYDIFGPLISGAALVLPAPHHRSDPAQLAHILHHHAITLWNSVPAQFAMLTDYLQSEPALQGPTLRAALLSGDWIPVDLPDRARRQLPDVRLYSLGGATEAAIWSVIYPISEVDNGWKSIPYGTPLANQRLYVLDNNLHDAPEGVVGELYIGGAGLAIGYLGDVEKTEQRFIYHPQSGERLYRTGDLACHSTDGNLQFMGREDNQLKVRGHRIELAEIESTLVRHHDIASAAALVIDRGRATQRLVAFAVSVQQMSPVHHSSLATTLPQAARQLATGLDKVRALKLARGIEAVSLQAMAHALLSLPAFAQGLSPVSLNELVESGSAAPRHQRLIGRWLLALCGQGYLRQVDASHYLPVRTISADEVEANWAELKQLDQEVNWGTDILRYMHDSHRALLELMRDETDPLNLLFPEGETHVAESAYRDNLVSRLMNALVCAAILQIAEEKQGKTLRLLEVGAGVGGTSFDLIPALAKYNVDYLFTDVSHYFLNEAEKRFGQWPWVRYALYDINQPALIQGIEPSSCDVILCANVLHNSRNVADVIAKLREILVPGGWLVFIEATTNSCQIMSSMEFKEGLTDFEDFRVEQGTTFLSCEQWWYYLQQAGASQLLMAPQDELGLAELGQHVFAAQFKNSQAAVTSDELHQHLAQWLPVWMLPNEIHLLERLPLTANGKVDRRVLADMVPVQRVIAQQYREPPATALERDIATIWQEVLKVDHIGRHDNFFALGGDSLLVAQAVSKMRSALPQTAGWGWDTLLCAMMNEGSLAALAQRFSQQSNAAYALLELQAGENSHTTLLLVHDGSGTLTPYRALLEKLNKRQRVLGLALNTPELFLAHSAEQGIALMASLSVQALSQQNHHHAPLHIVGYCLGGMLAQEVARQLSLAGQQISQLSIISSYPVPYRIDDDLLAEYIFARVMQADPRQLGYPADEEGFQTLLCTILKETPGVIPQGALARFSAGKQDVLSQSLLRLAAQTPAARLDAIRQQMRYCNSEFSTPARLAKQYQLIRHSLLAVHSHCMQGDTLPITFLRQQGEMQVLPGMNAEITTFWQQHSSQPLVLHDIPGDHFSCLNEEHCEAVLQALGLTVEGKQHD